MVQLAFTGDKPMHCLGNRLSGIGKHITLGTLLKLKETLAMSSVDTEKRCFQRCITLNLKGHPCSKAASPRINFCNSPFTA